jgi:hypothetical protein
MKRLFASPPLEAISVTVREDTENCRYINPKSTKGGRVGDRFAAVLSILKTYQKRMKPIAEKAEIRVR